jgi:hypothetical protein
MKRMFGPKGKEVIGDLRGLHNEELHDLYFSPNNINYLVLDILLKVIIFSDLKKKASFLIKP